MELIKPGINIDFVGKRYVALSLSSAVILLTILLLLWRGGPNFGVDFSGGTLIQIRLADKRSAAEIKDALRPVQLEDSIVQEFKAEGAGEYLIRVKKVEENLEGLGDRVEGALKAAFGKGVEIRRVEIVGATVGKDLRQKALLAIFYAILFMAIYISGRFEMKWVMSMVMALSLVFVVYIASMFGAGVTWLIVVALIVTLTLCWFLNLKYAMGAIVALIHDVVITLGAFALTDREISLPVIAAFLTIVGYSINDTIVVYDRIREDSHRFRRKPFLEIINASINETLSRTLLTGGTTLILVLALFILGGGVIHDFTFAILVGILVGTYSSIYVASPILLIWEGKFGRGAGKKRG